ncbi:MAG TPA: hypothetical protein VF624_07855 [Tepidisphaeraceae bacterium]|jgi:hypothetical protein
MALAIGILGLILLASFVAMTWIGARRYGLAGMLVVHFVVLFAYLTFAGVSLAAGVYEYDGTLSMIGLALQAFLLNCLLLPVAAVALWTRRSSCGK